MVLQETGSRACGGVGHGRSRVRWVVEHLQSRGQKTEARIFLRAGARERGGDVETVRANELDFAGDLAFCSWRSLYLSPL